MNESGHRASAKRLLILGTRGLPAAHGGFETFAQRLALFLVERGWAVSVYCQRDVTTVTQRISTDDWHGVERIHVEVATRGPVATLDFDARCTVDALKRPGVCLVLGYNGGAFLPLLRLAGRKVITNMDGIEWLRPKWSLLAKTWFWVNEWIAAWSSQRLVADHPAIMDHVASRRSRDAVVMIPYGGDTVRDTDPDLIRPLGLDPDRYFLVVARVEPDNSVLPIVKAFSRARRGRSLVVIGKIDDANFYHREIRAAASDEVMFPGPIYDGRLLGAVRHHARAYMHGHMMGGTNPSLVEALWAGNAVIAHDNRFNRWTAGTAGLYFANVDDCAAHIARFNADDEAVWGARAAARARADAQFRWSSVLESYEREFLALTAGSAELAISHSTPL